MLGLFTAAMFLVAGLSMLAQGLQTSDAGTIAIGGALLALTALRVVVLIRQWRANREEGDEE